MDEIYNMYWTTHAPHIERSLIDVEVTNCCACDKLLNGETNKFFNYFSGRLTGYIHKNCINKFKFPVPFIPIFFHNLSGYDMHFLITHLGDNISVIPCNKELYITVTKKMLDNQTKKQKYNLKFIDSNRFLSSSIEKLATYLKEEDFKILKKRFPIETEFKLMSRKGVFPYDYINGYEKLNEQSLPDRTLFFNRLNGVECSQANYEFAHEVWRTFKCRTLRDYMMLYLKSDVLILADIFESFREVSIKIYGLDPCNYITAPALSWDAMLKFTQVELDLISDPEIHSFLKTAVRGGITQCTHRIAKANNKYLKTFDPQKKVVHISYVDVNNLYGDSMSRNLPVSDFVFLLPPEIEKLDISEYNANSEIGYMLEIDLDYPDEIHDAHNFMPFCPENKIPPRGKIKKLVADLTDKKYYKIEIQLLQLAIQQGLVVSKIHRVLTYKQTAWLKPYIDLNTRERSNATNDFYKNFFKLMNNAVYGKTMENVDKRRDVRLVKESENRRNSEGYRALIAKPNFAGIKVFDNGLYGIELNRLEVHQDKPIYVGVAVLELSKWLMYNSYYNFFKKEDENIRCIYMDTDSFILSSEKDIYEIIKSNPSKFDTSNYRRDNIYGITPQNNKVLGLFKDENAGRIMTDFAGVKPKAYAYIVEMNENESVTVKKIKGIKPPVIAKLTYEKFTDTINLRETFYDEQMVIVSRDHRLFTEKVKKISLNYKDDKRYVTSNSINTLAWGHKDIRDITL